MEVRRLEQKDPVIIYVVALLFAMIASLVFSRIAKGNAYLYGSFLIPQVMYLGTLYFYTKLTKIEFSLQFKEKIKGEPLSYLWAVMIGAGLFFFALLPNYGVQKLFDLFGKEAVVNVPLLKNWYDYLLSLIVICVLPSLGEELLFRKAFADGMQEVGDWKVVFMLGAIFSLTHFNAAQTLHQFFIGCVFAYVYIKTRNVWLTVLMHFLNNVLALFLVELTGNAVWGEMSVLLISFFGGAVLAGAGIILLIKGKTKLDREKKEKLTLYPMMLLAGAGIVWLITVFV